ncbi:zf-HC2 domain-containing protein [Desulfobotulus sp. H1]|uniref:Zf-HC2 domain-containing protein n=1 Tax=Desulfobotulus pelophilus TaxID=2823377 RepID=A0ABT3NAV1_9BACT|nr:zf-HC2 domain-containing protein [Desulfobotulus pelophilus]MCW7754582.1 zf-HC2 domain-containing protein [Desulfobotulus pelophilus]
MTLPETPDIPAHCLALFDRLSAYVDGELHGEARRELEDHLQNCPKCRVCLTTLSQSIRICKRVGTRPVPEALSRKLEALARKMEMEQPPFSAN